MPLGSIIRREIECYIRFTRVIDCSDVVRTQFERQTGEVIEKRLRTHYTPGQN